MCLYLNAFTPGKGERLSLSIKSSFMKKFCSIVSRSSVRELIFLLDSSSIELSSTTFSGLAELPASKKNLDHIDAENNKEV